MFLPADGLHPIYKVYRVQSLELNRLLGSKIIAQKILTAFFGGLELLVDNLGQASDIMTLVWHTVECLGFVLITIPRLCDLPGFVVPEHIISCISVATFIL